MLLRRRSHPSNGDQAGDPAETEHLRRLRDRALVLQREESQADQHLLLVQDILRSMSEDKVCKEYPPL